MRGVAYVHLPCMQPDITSRQCNGDIERPLKQDRGGKVNDGSDYLVLSPKYLDSLPWNEPTGGLKHHTHPLRHGESHFHQAQSIQID